MRNTNSPRKVSGSRNKTLKTVVIVLAILVLAALAFLLYLLYSQGYLDSIFSREPSAASVSEETQAAPAHKGKTISFVVPEEKSFEIKVAEGNSFEMPEGPEIQGYTFLAWLDAQGNPETRTSLDATEDMSFCASYAVAFRDESEASVHKPYMSVDENGLFKPNESITRGEMAEIIYRFLDIDGVGSGFFIDVGKSDPLYASAATLKDLGLLEGDRLHAEDTVTYGELFRLLGKLFPAARDQYSFGSVSAESEYYEAFCTAFERGWLLDTETSAYDFVARKDFARIMNMLIGRGGTENIDISLVGTILDVSTGDEHYADIAEAVIEHACSVTDGAEIWTSSIPLELHRHGFFFIGPELRCIKDNGSPAIDEEIDNLYFDKNGVYSSGDAALDELVRAKLDELVDPETMSRDEMLEILYNAVLHDSFYLGGDKYAIGETGWETAKAYQMLTVGKGNCYAYAATFWAYARAIGCDAVCYSGTVGTSKNPHAWVEIELDGTTYIFDPTLEYETWYGPGTHTYEYFFMKTYESVDGWIYRRW